jgi:hypothetical protein
LSTCDKTGNVLELEFVSITANPFAIGIKVGPVGATKTTMYATTGHNNATYQLASVRVWTAAAPGFAMMAIEGPRAGETGAITAGVGSGRTVFIATTVNEYFKTAGSSLISGFGPLPNTGIVAIGTTANDLTANTTTATVSYSNATVSVASSPIQLCTNQILPQAAGNGRRIQKVRKGSDVGFWDILAYSTDSRGFIGTLNNVYYGSYFQNSGDDPADGSLDSHEYYAGADLLGPDGKTYTAFRPMDTLWSSPLGNALGIVANGTAAPLLDNTGGPVILVRKG